MNKNIYADFQISIRVPLKKSFAIFLGFLKMIKLLMILFINGIFFSLLNRYTSVQNNVNNDKTKIEITHSKTKNKSSLSIHAHVMRQAKKKTIA